MISPTTYYSPWDTTGIVVPNTDGVDPTDLLTNFKKSIHPSERNFVTCLTNSVSVRKSDVTVDRGPGSHVGGCLCVSQ